MPRIKTELLEEDMVVASDVKNIDNMLLIPAGCSLTGRQISILQAWGVAEIDVRGTPAVEDADLLAVLPPEIVARITAEIKNLFFYPDESNPIFVEVFKLMLQRHARRIARR